MIGVFCAEIEAVKHSTHMEWGSCPTKKLAAVGGVD
jgi:hypothetical protein